MRWRNNKKGFTLVELLIVMTILAIMTVILIGILNPIAIVNKANDARRKKDLGRIKVAMEEYFSDKGCYPTGTKLSELNNGTYCGSDTFSPWLSSWPCDPSKRTVYTLVVESGLCPHWFKIYTNLENKQDKDIPAGWMSKTIAYRSINSYIYNYGVSSTNVNWYEDMFNPVCVRDRNNCFTYTFNDNFVSLETNPIGTRIYSNSYTVQNLNCLVACCMDGLDVQGPCN